MVLVPAMHPTMNLFMSENQCVLDPSTAQLVSPYLDDESIDETSEIPGSLLSVYETLARNKKRHPS